MDRIRDIVFTRYKESKLKFLNLTPHTIHIVSNKGVIQDPKRKTFSADSTDVEVLLEIKPSDLPLPRVEMGEEAREEVDGIPVVQIVGENKVVNLPDPEEGVFIIVSGLVASVANAAGRDDVLAPNELVRDASNPGVILGAMSLRKG